MLRKFARDKNLAGPLGSIVAVGILCLTIGSLPVRADRATDEAYTAVVPVHPMDAEIKAEFSGDCFDHELITGIPYVYGNFCNVQGFGDPSRAEHLYESFILDAKATKNEQVAGGTAVEGIKSPHQAEQFQNQANLVYRVAKKIFIRKKLKDVLGNDFTLMNSFTNDRSLLESQVGRDVYRDLEFEADLFGRAVLAKNHQEAFLQHYVRSARDQKLKIISGDQLGYRNGLKYFRSIGMAQINRQAHKTSFDVHYDLIKNLQYGSLYAYGKWEQAKHLILTSKGIKPSSDLVTRKLQFINVARSMYSAFNSGSNLTRYTNWRLSVYHLKNNNFGCAKENIPCRNDQGYYARVLKAFFPREEISECRLQPPNSRSRKCNSKLVNLPPLYTSDVINNQRWIGIHLDAALAHDDLRALPANKRPGFLRGRKLLIDAENSCLGFDSEVICASDPQTLACVGGVQSLGRIDSKRYAFVGDSEILQTLGIRDYLKTDRVQACTQNVPELLPIGSFARIQTQSSGILLRDHNQNNLKDRHGSSIVVPKNAIVQILDFSVKPIISDADGGHGEQLYERYYKVRWQRSKEFYSGFVFGGVLVDQPHGSVQLPKSLAKNFAGKPQQAFQSYWLTAEKDVAAIAHARSDLPLPGQFVDVAANAFILFDDQLADYVAGGGEDFKYPGIFSPVDHQGQDFIVDQIRFVPERNAYLIKVKALDGREIHSGFAGDRMDGSDFWIVAARWTADDQLEKYVDSRMQTSYQSFGLYQGQ